MKCKNCEHFVEFNKEMVCDRGTLDFGDCPSKVNAEDECYWEDLG